MTIISQFLDTDGDGTGTKNAVGDYSSAATDFYFQSPEGTSYDIERMLVSVEDTSGMKAEEYGDTGSALTNGISVLLQKNGATVEDLTDGIPVKTNAHWGRMCYDVDIKSWGSTPTNELLVARWTFAKSGVPLRLYDEDDWSIVVRLNDSFVGLISHYFLVQGHRI